MKHTVGILAYGSLIDAPDWEIEEVRVQTIKGLFTPFHVEFARSSSKRGGAPTLVPYEGGGHVRAQVLIVDTSVTDATNRLYRRESDKVGTDQHSKHSNNPGPNKVIVRSLECQFGLDVVLYTCFGATIDEPTAVILAQYAIDSVAEAKPGKDGISYLNNAMNAGIETPLSAAYAEEILRRMGTLNLADALEKVMAS
ncbi:MAG: hypothetical protein OXC42_00660 [Gammaproteobacteria bacterium]|nr:hypothetical protein [Gammaproteobacteria bacterium]